MLNIISKSFITFSRRQAIIHDKRYQNYRTLTTVAKKYVFSQYFSGEPKPANITLVEEKLPAIKDGGMHYLYTLIRFYFVF
jgi:hypothetical protein